MLFFSDRLLFGLFLELVTPLLLTCAAGGIFQARQPRGLQPQVAVVAATGWKH